MNFQFEGAGMQGLAVLAVAWGIFVAVFWMVVGWRAMTAHERLAESVRELAARSHRLDRTE